MRVKLQNNWFAPNGHHYDKGVCEVPDELSGKLPSTAKVLDAAAAAEPAPEAPSPSLKDLDPERAAAKAEDKVADEAEKQREANAARIKAALDKEKGGKK